MSNPQETLTPKALSERVWIGAGARDGDRLANMRAALRLLEGRGVGIVRASSLYETEPVALAGDRTLLNGVVEVTTAGGPRDLLADCLEVERALGRRRDPGAGGGGPRPIDLDILLFGQRMLSDGGLTVPHPRMHLRRFVLAPLAEIAPEARHPGLGLGAAGLMDQCRDACWVKRLLPPDLWLVEVTRRFR